MLRSADVDPPIVLPAAGEEQHTVAGIGHGVFAGRVGADQVAFDDIAGRGRRCKRDAVPRVARDHITQARAGPADRVARRPD